jgi:lipopolysaccharide/colanic/teichoic acid biosynthesis glycosyltransferase
MTLSNKMPKTRSDYSVSSHPMSYLLDPEYGFYIEGYFVERLMLERQRTERSKKSFLMMLLDIDKYTESGKKEIKRKLGSILFSSTRETDLKGWYKNNSVIGVLFTEIGDIERETFRNKILKTLCEELNLEDAKNIKISFHFFPENPDEQNGNPPDHELFYPDPTRRNKSKKSFFFMKRMIDVLGSVAFLVLFSPFFIVIPILIKLSSSGPIIYRQERVGLNGKKFLFLKFRSMYSNNDSSIHQEFVKNLIRGQRGNVVLGMGSEEKEVYKITNDKRVTPLGKYLRKLSLDEFPQIFNVLKGDMSLVGPRPPIPYELEGYEVWHRRRVLEVKPGISGLWQVKGRSRTTFDDMVRMDIQYTKEQSLWLDMKILMLTPWVVITAKGAH